MPTLPLPVVCCHIHPKHGWICMILLSNSTIQFLSNLLDANQPLYSCCALSFTQHNYFSAKTAEVHQHDKYVGIVGNNYHRFIHTSNINSRGHNEGISISITFLNSMTIRSKMLTNRSKMLANRQIVPCLIRLTKKASGRS